jgi:outer membrane protein OmpA-like peptidoglycan-associated protein
MYRSRTLVMSEKPMSLWLKRIIFSSVILVCAHAMIFAQEIQRTKPTWWVGGSGAANINFYYGMTQMLDAATTTRDAFHDGIGMGFNFALLTEYRPNPVWGGIFQIGYDDRRSRWDDIITAPASLSARISYMTIEPSLRIAPFSSEFFIFFGPTMCINIKRDYTYTQATNSRFQVKGAFSDMRSILFSGQAGMGLEIPLTSPSAVTQIDLAPFVSFSPDVQGPRTVESWDVHTLRIGAALKFGWGDAIAQAKVVAPAYVPEGDVRFSIRAPKAVPTKRRVRETFPLLNYVFFDAGSSTMSTRYVLLTKDQAAKFKEEQLQEVQPISMTGRSLRQMTVYYNILNIVGDRMRRNAGTAISLSGASEQGPGQGKARAETIKQYLVDVFGIDGARITTDGRDKPLIPSEVRGATKELALVGAEDRRVDIGSTSPEMMIQVGGDRYYMLRPVQIVTEVEDPLDSQVIFNVIGAKEVLASWSLELTDEQGKVQRFGPSTREHENVSGNAILGDRAKGEFKVVMLGETKRGNHVRKEGSLSLVRRDAPKEEAVRFSVLFEFDQSKTIASYSTFLTDVVTPLVPDSGTVVIHGHTDIVGEEEYNNTLSSERAQDARSLIEATITKSGKRGITFETFWFGEDLLYAPFDNFFPEGRFYNRTVIIDIVPK